ncbi:hybrid sensor histidine kinase/response regulator transcription factor [Botryobacter ruber]|uniref:hybrid sensor histidine kinase/response regulator transcription factor n=1 Tax=Botryobacter ruber TaxID=2171629 RepID=UPI000E0C33FA|nr:hybrid sensor histidine kinase/response regulator transcription factor [Botryobacter ruber]
MLPTKKLFAFTLMLFLAAFFSEAVAKDRIHFRNYTVTDGLSSNTVWAISQDEQGYMWFGTKDGLSRFDGYQFKSFKFDKKNPVSIGNNFIRKIFKYDDKTYWVGTEEGIYLLDLEKESFRYFEKLGPQLVFDIIRDKRGNLWIATGSKGLFQYNPKTEALRNFVHRPNNPQSISMNLVRNLTEDNDGNIWIATVRGLDVLDPVKMTFRHYYASQEPGSISHSNIIELYKDLSGNIWVGTLTGGLNLYNKSTDTFKQYLKSDNNSINDNIVRSIYQPNPNKLYIGTEKGLNILDIPTQTFTHHTNKNNDPFSISDDAIYTIFEDKEGGIWLGTYFGGVNYFHGKDTNIELYYPTGEQRALSGNAVSTFLEDDAGKVWVGTEDGGLNLFDVHSKTFKQYPFEPWQENLSYHNIHTLYKDKSGNIWIGTFSGGLNIYNPKTGKIKRYLSNQDDPTTISNNTVYTINEDRKGRIWVGTVAGVSIYNPEKDNFTRINDHNLTRACIYDIYEDDRGVIWFATYNFGLIAHDQKTNKWRQYSKSADPNSISTNKVISIFCDKSGNLWLGTEGGGLNFFDRSKNTFKVIDEQYGISSSIVYGVLEDPKGQLWLSTNNGIYKFDPKTYQSKRYGKFDKLQSRQFNFKAYLKASDGNFYFGGINGFNVFKPDSLKSINSKNAIALTNLQLFNKDVTISSEKSPLNKLLHYSRHLTLSHDQSVVSFEYAALSFISPQKTSYAFKMEGFDKDWNYVEDQRKATYTNLPAGEYTFRVKATNNDGTWNKQAASMKITILPPFYKTTVAYLFYLALAVFVFVLARRAAIRNVKRKNKIRLERLKNKEEKEFYKQKMDFFITMAHEVRTPLTLITAPLEDLIASGKGGPEVQEQLRVMDDNSNRLLTLVNQLLDFRRIESKIYTINLEQMELVSMVQALYSRFSPIAQKQDIRFSMNTHINRFIVETDPEALTKILSNLLSNAFKFTRTSVKLSINAPVNNENGRQFFSISIEDDGIGIPKEQLDSIFKKFFKITSGKHHYSNLGGTGIGLALAKSLSIKHGGDLLVESEEGVKTTFTVLLPFKECDQPAAMPEPVALAADEDNTPEPDAAAENSGKTTILLVEDDESLRDYISKGLEGENYRCVTAQNGLEALECLDKDEVDLIISDLMMPEMDGITLCQQVKSNIAFSHLPFVLLTAQSNSDAEIEGIESGADFYITKPFKWRHLKVVIKNQLEARATLKLKFSQQPFADTTTLTTNTRDNAFLKKIVETIEERITDPKLSVEELSREMAMSRSSLHKKLKSLTGQVPNEFIRLVRLKHAAKLLLQNEYNISEVGYMVGFNSHSYFSKCFVQQFKITPSEFTEKHLQELESTQG